MSQSGLPPQPTLKPGLSRKEIIMRFKVGDKVAFDVAWNVQFGEVVTIQRGVFGNTKCNVHSLIRKEASSGCAPRF